MKLFDTRNEYKNENLLPTKLDPFKTLASWYEEASQKEVHSPNAMTLSTLDSNGYPQSRVVLLKSLEEDGLVFFTNTNSPKALEIKQHAKVSLHFYWKSIHKQVRIIGIASSISRSAAAEYFLTRPLESQISAWVSNQSEPISSRETLIEKLKKFRDTLPSKLGAPQHWGGFKVTPHAIEFWQGAEHRLHHRVFIDLNTQPDEQGLYNGVVLSP